MGAAPAKHGGSACQTWEHSGLAERAAGFKSHPNSFRVRGVCLLCTAPNSVSQTCIWQVFMKPIMFALDNVLTGTAMAKVLSGVAVTTGLSEGILYALSCSMTIAGGDQGARLILFHSSYSSSAPHPVS